MSVNIYGTRQSIPNKLLNEDGSVTDLMGNSVTPTSKLWEGRRSIPNKFLNADGTYSTLQEIISGSIDTEIYVVVEELPASGDSNKIYLVPQQDGTIDEYHWTGTKWDPIGMLEFDITDYSTTAQVQSMIATALQNSKDYTDEQLEHYVPMQSFPESFDTTHSTETFFQSIQASNPTVGAYYLGLVRLTDMPTGLIQAEVQVSVYPNGVLYATMRSADLEPYVWEANSYDYEGWQNHNSETLQSANDYTDTAIQNSITNVLGGDY